MRLLKLPFIFFFLFCHASLGAVDRFDDIINEVVPSGELSNTQLRALREELKIQRMFIEGVKSIEIRGGEFADINRASTTIEELVRSSFGAKSSGLGEVMADSVKNTVKASVNKNSIKQILQKLKNFVWGQANSKKIMLTSTARRFGFDVGLVYLLTLQVDLTFPTVMMAMGHMEFAPLLMTPVSSMATGTYAAAKSGVKMRQLIKNLGGLTSAREHFDIYKKVKGFFKTSILPAHDIIDIGVAGRNYTLTIERQNLLSKFKQKLGWNKNLNYKNLVAYLESEGLAPRLLETIKNSNRPEQVKLLRLLHRIEIENREGIMAKLKERFGNFINDADGLPDFTEGRKWAAKIGRAQSFEEFSRLMMTIPDDIPPHVFDKLWRNHILPQASRNVGPFISVDTYKAFRNLENSWQTTLRKTMSESVEHGLGPHWKTKIADYFFTALGPVNGCSALFFKRGRHAPLL